MSFDFPRQDMHIRFACIIFYAPDKMRDYPGRVLSDLITNCANIYKVSAQRVETAEILHSGKNFFSVFCGK